MHTFAEKCYPSFSDARVAQIHYIYASPKTVEGF